MASILDQFVQARGGLIGQRGQEIGQQGQQAEQDRFLETSNLRSIGIGALEALGQPDQTSQDALLSRRIQEITARGGDPRDTIEALDTPFEQRQQVLQNAVQIAQQAGALQGIAGASGGKPRVQSSKALPGGLVQLIMSDGSVKVVSPSEADALLIQGAEERGVELTGERAGARGFEGITGRELGQLRSDINKRITTSFQNAPVQIRSLERVAKIFDAAKTGTTEAFLAGVGKVFPGATPATLEDALAASGDFVLNSLTKLKGPITEKELAFMQTISPSVRNSPEGNRLIIGRAIQAQKDELELAKAMRKFKQGGGNLEDFDVENFIAEKEGQRNAKFDLSSIQPAQDAQAAAPRATTIGRFQVEIE